MSPEQIRNLDLDARSDLFSVATVVYEMLVGRSPFAAEVPGASIAAVLEREVDPEESIPPRLWLELSRCLAKRPYERHATAAELSAALLASIDATRASVAESLATLGLRVDVAPVPSADPSSASPRPPASRRPWALGLAGVAVVAAAGVGAFVFREGAVPLAEHARAPELGERRSERSVPQPSSVPKATTRAISGGRPPRGPGTAHAVATKPGF
jgi:serine/threonine-protein kinase